MALALSSMIPQAMVTPTAGKTFAQTLPGAGPFGFFDPLDLTPVVKV